MKTSQKPLDSKCLACLLVVLVIVLILEPATLLFAVVFLWIWANNDGKSYRGTRRYNRGSFSDDAVNKPHWSDSSSYSSSSSSSGGNMDIVNNTAYSYLGSNIYHK
jgi:hypothetical protein